MNLSINNFSQKINFQNQIPTKSKKSDLPSNDNNIKVDKGILMLTCLGITMAAGVAILKGKSGKVNPESLGETITNIADKSKLLKEIDFNKGIASIKNTNEKFSGVISDVLNNGDKITLEYSQGILQKSTRSGGKNFTKVFKEVNGDKIVETIENNATRTTNITNIEKKVKEAQDKLNNILENKDNLSLNEFRKQTKEIKFKSKKQKVEITNIINDKKLIEEQTKQTAQEFKEITELTQQEPIISSKNNTDTTPPVKVDLISETAKSQLPSEIKPTPIEVDRTGYDCEFGDLLALKEDGEYERLFFGQYDESPNVVTNKYLRTGVNTSESTTEEIENIISSAKTMMNKIRLQHDAILYRGVQDFNNIPAIGETFIEKGFTSTSAKKFATGYYGSKMIKIIAPKGTKCIPSLPFIEILLDAGTNFKVLSKTDDLVELLLLNK